MKTLISMMFLLALYNSANAGVSEQQMQEMMQQAEAAQQCFEKVDQSKFQQLQMEMTQMQGEIKALCDSNKRSEAMSTARKYEKKYQDDADIKQMKKCADMMKGMMAQMPALPNLNMPSEADKDKHICDVL